jgi:hypothetical protein
MTFEDACCGVGVHTTFYVLLFFLFTGNHTKLSRISIQWHACKAEAGALSVNGRVWLFCQLVITGEMKKMYSGVGWMLDRAIRPSN